MHPWSSIVNSQAETTEGSVIGTNPYTFQDIDVNIVLNVTPRINSPNEITMQLDTQVSAIINYVGPDKDRPVVSNRSAKTNVVVGNGETLLIGGVILEDDSDITGRVPFFGNIPIIKNFFKFFISVRCKVFY